MSDTGNTDLDHRGVYAQPRYINDMQPTTKFHPSELPADPEAIRRFPKHLIDVNHYTESPGSDSSAASRLERARETFMEHAHRFGGVEAMKEFLAGLGHHGTGSPPATNVASALTEGPVSAPTAEDAPNVAADATDEEVAAAAGDMPEGPHSNVEEPSTAEGAVGQSDAGPTAVPGAEQAAGDVPVDEGAGADDEASGDAPPAE